ncbi:hypothetical protein C8R46DRAFT_902591, partial [Mycena filopes]
MPPPENRHDDPPKKGSLDRVDILPPNYFDRPHGKFTPEETVVQIHDVCNTFCLNEEQERAFKIVADHASGSPSEPLKMYIGGMGGSGKSQVFKAIIALFATRKEDYRFMVLGPTGSTAALVNGSTYHSVFRIPRETKSKNSDDLNGIRDESANLAAVNERLRGVDYVFIDEVSMMSCNDLQTLAVQ